MPQKSSQLPSHRFAVLLLAALLASLVVAPCLAQPPAAASTPAAAPDASFVASLLGAPAGLDAGLPPPVLFLQSSTGCTSNSQCPPDKLCCRACAFPGCTLKACLTPMNGHCPLIP